MRNGIYGWLGGRYGSPTEYGQPLDDSYLYEDEEDPVEILEAPAGDDWTPVKIETQMEAEDEGTYRQVLAGVLPPGLGG